MLSVTVLQLRLKRTLLEFGALIAVSLTFMGVALRVEHFPLPLRICWSILGMASLVILAARTIWSKPGERTVPGWALTAAVAGIGSGWIVPLFLKWAEHGALKVLDLYLISFDASLGFQPSFAMGAVVLRSLLLGRLVGYFYMGIPLVVNLVFAEQLLRDVKKSVLVFVAFFLSGSIGALFYNLFPALGPFYICGNNFPLRPLPAAIIQHMRLEPLVLPGARNAMPSLHMTWAILAVWYSRGTSWWVRLAAWIFLVFTVIATLGIGEHYFIDLIVAFPFSLMLYALFMSGWSSWRMRALVFGLATTILWMTLLRFQTDLFWVSPLIPWGTCLLTVGATLLLKRQLELSSKVAESAALSGTVANLSAGI